MDVKYIGGRLIISDEKLVLRLTQLETQKIKRLLNE